jgi:HPt (histidine-containing phosphotransfer) domain-containing protein
MADGQSTLDGRTLRELRESVGDQDFLAELLDEVLADAPAELEALRMAATSGDAEAARRSAHTLKSHGRTFGAANLASLCQEAEAAADEGDLAAVLARVDAIGEEWERVHLELLAFRDGRA